MSSQIFQEPIIVVHGGAWSIPDHMETVSREGVKNAAKAGYSVLLSGGSALDAVTAAVMALEDDPAFDAGRGSVLTDSGKVEMDAMVMDGENLETGAVASVNNVRNPIMLARKVMEKTDHTLLVSHGAVQLAETLQVEKADQDYLITEAGRQEWETYKQYNQTVTNLFNQRINSGHDTVGAVARDKNGNLSCATSTGGITGKRPGRVGDSPLVGCGGYADNHSGAVSTTGHGESITKVCLAHKIISRLEDGESPRDASSKSLKFMFDRVAGSGGCIVIDKHGRYSAQFTTERMPWASISQNVISHGFLPEECNVEKI